MSAATATRPARPAPPARTGELTGLGTLMRFALRRDRVRLPMWIIGILLATVGTAASFPASYPDAEARAGALLTIDNPGTTALIGAVYGDGDYTYGIITGHNLLVLISAIAALMSIFTLVRHTRAEEESERAELVRSGPVGRFAPAAAAMTVVIGANLVLALVLALGLGSLGIDTVTWEGSFVFGAAVGSVGLVFAGIAAVTAQLSEDARTASSAAGMLLAGAYVLRALGDVSNETLSWFSPLGWAQATEPYYADDWAPLLLPVGAAVVLLVVAVALSRRRDVGAGVLGTRPGPARAGAGLRGPFGLAWRSNRGTLIGWTVGLGIFGLLYGPVLSEASTYLEDLPIMAEFMPDIDASGEELFAATVILVVAILCAVPPLQIVLRLRGEETAGRVGPLLTTPLPRWRWLGANLMLAVLGGAWLLAVMGFSIGLGAGYSMDDYSWVGTSTIAAVSYLPAVGVIVGLAALLLGWAPRAAAWSWALVGLAAVVAYFGGIFDLPQWLMNGSPFEHVPEQPAFDFDGRPLGWLSLVAVALSGASLVGIRRRDVQEA
ncbi:ABC transporter permease [Pseudactinotalea sp. Z1732]|uniref:ABC transporter permease n=1 Tax=Micrococcales TaxID=85006 RepID=UPI003C7A608E